MEQFSEEFFVSFVRNELSKYYYSYPKVREMFELDDIVQDVIMWYYQPMKNGEQRLAHYLSKCGFNHFCNHLRSSLKQTIPALLRYSFMKNIPMSLNVPIDRDNETTEFLDMIADKSESSDSLVQFSDLLMQIKKSLQETRTISLYKEALKSNPSLSYNEFRIYPSTILSVWPIVREQINIVQDLMNGYKSTELRLKYKDFDILLQGVRSVVTNYYRSQGEDVFELLGRKRKSI